MKEVTNLDTSIDVILLQPLNIEFTSVTAPASKFPKFIVSSELHPSNKNLILVTSDQIKFEKSIDWIFTTFGSDPLLKNSSKVVAWDLKFIVTSVPADISKAWFISIVSSPMAIFSTYSLLAVIEEANPFSP